MSYDLSLIPSAASSLGAFERYCAITVALKIADESCKMDAYEKDVFMRLYEALPADERLPNEDDTHTLIKEAIHAPSAKTYAKIKRLREEAMEIITRPKMKAFKAMVRVKITR